MTKPSEGHINLGPEPFVRSNVLRSVCATHVIPIPTYGNYGGPRDTPAGTLGGTAFSYLLILLRWIRSTSFFIRTRFCPARVQRQPSGNCRANITWSSK